VTPTPLAIALWSITAPALAPASSNAARDAGCASCHPARAVQWESSAHAQSWTSQLFQAGLAVERRQFCIDCHAPSPSVADASRGIGCGDCHTPSDPHGARATAALRAADFCERCHEFATPEWNGGEMRTTALPMQSTYSEWQSYQRAGGEGTCQSCHMPAGDHAMHGAHDADQLRRALDVRASVAEGVATFALRSINVGHRFPTGDLFRNLTLEIDDGGGDWRTIAREGRTFDTVLDEATLDVHKVETANTTLAPGEVRTVTVAAPSSIAWRVRYHYGSDRDERFARVSYDALVMTLAEGTATAAKSQPAKMPAGFVDIADLAPDILVDARYAGADNFLGRPARGYGAARCLLTRPAARALAAVQRDVAALGLGLKVYDCYRPQRAVDDFVAWSRDPSGPATDLQHHPVVPKSQLVQRGYIAASSGHSRGSTVDLTLVPVVPKLPPPVPPVDCRTVEGPQAPDGSLNMGTTFDCFDERAQVANAGVSSEARRNRLLLKSAMERHGFVGYAKEWWHFTLAGEPFPKATFDFEIHR
jgi:D-alanyl-D-alanine dipeptidase